MPRVRGSIAPERVGAQREPLPSQRRLGRIVPFNDDVRRIKVCCDRGLERKQYRLASGFVDLDRTQRAWREKANVPLSIKPEPDGNRRHGFPLQLDDEPEAVLATTLNWPRVTERIRYASNAVPNVASMISAASYAAWKARP